MAIDCYQVKISNYLVTNVVIFRLTFLVKPQMEMFSNSQTYAVKRIYCNPSDHIKGWMDAQW